MYKISVFDEVFSPLYNICYNNWNSVLFSISIATIAKETHSTTIMINDYPPTQLWSLSTQTNSRKMESNKQTSLTD